MDMSRDICKKRRFLFLLICFLWKGLMALVGLLLAVMICQVLPNPSFIVVAWRSLLGVYCRRMHYYYKLRWREKMELVLVGK
jgi:hypothetical protein